MSFSIDIYTRYIAQNKNISSNDKQKCLRDKQSTNKEKSLTLSSQLPKKNQYWDFMKTIFKFSVDLFDEFNK